VQNRAKGSEERNNTYIVVGGTETETEREGERERERERKRTDEVYPACISPFTYPLSVR